VKSEDDTLLAEQLDGSMTGRHFSAYFDESGTKVDTVAFCVPSYIPLNLCIDLSHILSGRSKIPSREMFRHMHI
jgi:hypothetical protein